MVRIVAAGKDDISMFADLGMTLLVDAAGPTWRAERHVPERRRHGNGRYAVAETWAV
jgi:hypothetical protein